ncbi:MAG: Dam family site-specific DNA-(adenine-N6)-methyltransferase [Terracidiphilus sp.]|jgi:DNA adenine methylase
MALRISAENEATKGSNVPLLKWPGGKRALINSISPIIPKQFGKYYEPFIGGGAVFFALSPGSATLSDVNSDLIETYVEVRDRPLELIRILRKMRNSERDYYKVRAEQPDNKTERAARFIYLCTLAFNGIHRYNLKGEFNVPYGFKSHLAVCDEEKILACSARLKVANLVDADFEIIVRKARKGDLIYLDPPYTVAHNNNGFIKYNAAIFSWQDQLRLAVAANAARERGCHIIVSNADHASVRALYRDFKMITIKRHSIIASSNKFRKPITECLFWSHLR